MDTAGAAFAAVLDDIGGRIGELDHHDRVPDDLSDRLLEAGAARLLVPRALGGRDLSLTQSMAVLEVIARVDASVAWRVLAACEFAPLAARLPVATFDALYSAGPDLVGAALLAPKGTATETDGGYLVRGCWPNVTGCDRCVWLCGVCMVVDGHGGVRRADDGSPVLRAAVLPQANARLVGTWHTVGLRAADAHDVVVDGVFVPRERTFDLFAPATHREGGAARVPLLSLFSLHAGALALGVASAALDDVGDQGAMVGPGCRTDDGTHSHTSARATLGRRARAMLFDLGRELEDLSAGPSDASGIDLRLEARAAGAWAVAAAGSIVSTALELGAPGGLRPADLARRFRDVHALSQHVALIQDHLSPASAVLVGAC